jgi:hypothetical protein
MTDNEVFDLADVLQVRLQVGSDRSVSGRAPRPLMFGALSMTVQNEVVSGYGGFHGVGAVMRVRGDLGVFVWVGKPRGIAYSSFVLSVLDLSRLPKRGARLLEAARPAELKDVMPLVEPAEVARFERARRTEPWSRVLLNG